MLKDKIILGAIIGLLADAVKLAANFAMYKLGWTNVVFWQIVATRFLNKNDLFKPSALFIGAVADITFSAALGIIFIYFINFFGRNYLFIKGIGYGLSTWVLIFGTLLGLSVEHKIPPTTGGIMVTLIAHFIYGLAIATFTMLLFKEQTAGNQFAPKIKPFKSYIPTPATKPLRSEDKNKNEHKKVIKLKPKKLIKND
ncbi:MAG: hypothetical protein GXW85_01140 [Clostridia bacterium]|nr:hypothetical protein [Clostridia bacterium]